MLPGDGRVVVVSPHLDDGVLSLGAGIARTSASGRQVVVVTVFANDPGATVPPGEWDAACGFTSAADAARTRRDEDARACSAVGAEPVWLAYGDAEYGRKASASEIWGAVASLCDGRCTVLLPGFPLVPPDHAWLTELFVRRPLPSSVVAFYVEQPYAALRLLGRGRRASSAGLSLHASLSHLARLALRTDAGRRIQQPSVPGAVAALPGATVTWTNLGAGRRERRLKRRAIGEYRSQLAGFGPLVLARMALAEACWGGEGIGFLERAATGY
jgi:hypothetical protein